MRIIMGAGRDREVMELPGLAVRAREPQQHQTLIRNLQERICGAEFALARKGFNIYR